MHHFKIKIIFPLVFNLIFLSCAHPNPRMPMSKYSKQKAKVEESLARKDFELDRKIILNYISENDSLHFTADSNAFWWAYLKKKSGAKKADENTQINYTYAVYNFDNERIYSKEDIGTKYAVMGSTKQIHALTTLLKKLSEGEKAILLVPSFSAYSFRGDGNKIGPLQPLIIELEILKLKPL